MINTFLTTLLETLINRTLALDPQTVHRLRKYAGQLVRIELTDSARHHTLSTFNFLLTEHGLHIISTEMQTPDVTIRGSLAAFGRQLGSSPTTHDFLISGNVELGQQLRDLLHSMEIDWEEQLAKVTGDAMAHAAGQTVRGFLGWGKKAVLNFQRDLASYLQEEAQYLPSSVEVQHYLAEVIALRHRAERLEARWRKFEVMGAKSFS